MIAITLLVLMRFVFEKLGWRRITMRWVTGWWDVVLLFMYDVSPIFLACGRTITRRWMRITMRRNTDRWAGGGYSRWISFVSIMMMVVVLVIVVLMLVVMARRRMRVTMRWYTNRRTGFSDTGRTFHYRDSRYRSCIMSRSDMSLTSELITPRRIVRNSESLMLGCISLMKPGRSSIFR